jgi:glycine cleavage system H lipoate-binding protein
MEWESPERSVEKTMNEHDFLALDTMRSAEYLISVLYVLLFIPFWRFVSTSIPRPVHVTMDATAPAGGWFQVPADVWLHRGHAWLKNASDGAAWIGMDDFAHRLMGPISKILLPGVGSVVREGQPALQLQIDGKDFEVLSPVDGTVTAINLEAVEKPEELGKDPYGKAWLFRVKPTGLSTSFSALFSGEKARQFLDDAFEALFPSPNMAGALAQDGGLPVSGFARELSPDGWDVLIRSQLQPDRRQDNERAT